MQLPKETKLTLKDGDQILLEEELVVLNGLISQAQVGVEVKDPATAEIWTNRLSTLLQEKYQLNLAPTVCFLISVEVNRKLGELEQNFTQGL